MRKGFSYKKLLAETLEVKTSMARNIGELQQRIRELESQLMDKNMRDLEEVRKMRQYVAQTEQDCRVATDRATAWMKIARKLNEALMIARFETEMANGRNDLMKAAVVPGEVLAPAKVYRSEPA